MFQNAFSFEGRIRRSEYGLSILIHLFIGLVINFFLVIAQAEHTFAFLYFPVVWFIVAQGVKRCHDVSKSGWHLLIPFYNILLIFLSGQIGVNKYGEDPKQGEEDF